MFDSVVLSASRTGPVLKKTVLDYRYGQYALLGLTENFVFVYNLIKETVSDNFLINVDCDPESRLLQQRHWTVCIDGPEADKLRLAPQISRLKTHVRVCYSLITQPADNSDVFSEPEQKN